MVAIARKITDREKRRNPLTLRKVLVPCVASVCEGKKTGRREGVFPAARSMWRIGG
jgi:hypothetical protein